MNPRIRGSRRFVSAAERVRGRSDGRKAVTRVMTVLTLSCATFVVLAACGQQQELPTTSDDAAPPDGEVAASLGVSGRRSTKDTAACEDPVTGGRAASDSERADEEIDVGQPPHFIAVGDAAYTSYDGICWARQQVELSNAADVVYGDGRALVIGQGGRLVVSDDGHQWNEIDIENESLRGMSATAYGNNRFVAVGEGFAGLLHPVVATSPDGISWTRRDVDFPRGLQSVTYGKDRFVAVGTALIASSLDGIVWNVSPFREPRQLFDIAYGNGIFVVTGGRGAIYSSPDSVAWTEQSSGLSNVFFLHSVTYGNGMFVAVGEEYDPDKLTTSSTIIASQDGVAWDVQHIGLSQSLSDVTYGNNKFVAVGANNVRDDYGNTIDSTTVALTSPDGIDWTATALDRAIGWLSSVTSWSASSEP